MMIANGSILLFDGVCNLCDSLVGFIIRHDRSGKIMFCSLQSDSVKSLLAEYGFPPGYIKSLVYIKETKYYTRSTAVLNILKDLGGGWQLFYGFIIVPAFIRDFFYSLIAAVRYRIFGKKVSCLMPDA
jgi:predicted DCC family thiol-disulfide oxidoreductase YuxK